MDYATHGSVIELHFNNSLLQKAFSLFTISQHVVLSKMQLFAEVERYKSENLQKFQKS